MEKQISQIISDVRVILDENDVQNALLADAEYTLELDEIIASKIEDAMDAILLNAPLELLGAGEAFTPADVQWYAGGTTVEAQEGELAWCRFLRPANYMRLVKAMCSDWHKAVKATVSEDDDEYAQQRSMYAGLRGCPERPVVADVESMQGRVIEMYCSRTREVAFNYIKNASAYRVSGSNITLPDARLYRPICYQIAGLTLITLKDSEHAQTLFAMAQGLLDSQSMAKEKE